MHPELRARHVLLLQGPVGPFFRRLAGELHQRGVAVTKVNFNAGDALFFRPGPGREVIAYRGRLADWPAALRRLLAERPIDAILLFGDQRPVHVAARQLAAELGLAVWVFEEGYLRPDYVTLERGGVNGNSSLPRDPEFYRRATAALPPPAEPVAIGNAFYHHAVWTALHSMALTFGAFLYPRYRHHRNSGTFYNLFCWVRGGVRKARYRRRDRGVVERLVREHDRRYWVLPLQVHCDSQLQHSDYASIEALIDEVVETFAGHAPPGHVLVVKHHPHDTPYRDYTRHLRALADRLGLAGRLRYVHDVHLPTLLKHARGVVTMNSTVGTSALHHRTPVKVLGRAIYDLPGLTCQRPLAEFFGDPGTVDAELYERFARWLRAANQLNGSFYKRVRGLGTRCGVDRALFAALPVVDGAPRPLPELPRRDHVAP
jgi:capsule polysaccharide modification protein KpsS